MLRFCLEAFRLCCPYVLCAYGCYPKLYAYGGFCAHTCTHSHALCCSWDIVRELWWKAITYMTEKADKHEYPVDVTLEMRMVGVS